MITNLYHQTEGSNMVKLFTRPQCVHKVTTAFYKHIRWPAGFTYT